MSHLRKIAILSTSFIVWLAVGQEPSNEPGTPGEPFRIQVDVDLVVLHATVVDGKGRHVAGLTRQNFRILDDGREQKIRVFSDEDIPVTVGIVVDNSGSMAGKRESVVAAALAFFHTSNPRDEVFLVHFNEFVGFGLPAGKLFTSDVEELEDAFAGFAPRGMTALYDAIATALRHLERGHCDKKVVLVISDGGDNASKTDFDEVLRLADRSGAVIYTIGLFDQYADDKNPGVVKRLARATGGEAFLPADINKVVPICEQIARDIRNQYMLGYLLKDRYNNTAYHKVEVTARSPRYKKLRVRTREGYYP